MRTQGLTGVRGVLDAPTGCGSGRVGWMRAVPAGAESVEGTSASVCTTRGKAVRGRTSQGKSLFSILALVAFLGGVSLGLNEVGVGEGRELSRASVAAVAGEEESAARVAPQVGNLESVAAELHTVVVRPGDTLWSIAGRTFPEADPRAVVTAFREANGGQLRSLQVGSVLVVPASV